MKQPVGAPVVLAAGMVGGITAIIVGSYTIGDCIRYQSQKGECAAEVAEGGKVLAGGLGIVLTGIAGLFTYNRKLERPGEKASTEETLENALNEEIRKLRPTHTQDEIARKLKITRYRVRKGLKTLGNQD